MAFEFGTRGTFQCLDMDRVSSQQLKMMKDIGLVEYDIWAWLVEKQKMIYTLLVGVAQQYLDLQGQDFNHMNVPAFVPGKTSRDSDGRDALRQAQARATLRFECDEADALFEEGLTPTPYPTLIRGSLTVISTP